MSAREIYHLFQRNATADADGVAVEANGTILTWSALANRVNRLAALLPAASQHRCIAYYGKNIPDFISLLLFADRQQLTFVVFPQNQLFVNQAIQDTDPLIFTSDEESAQSLLALTGHRKICCLPQENTTCHQPETPQAPETSQAPDTPVVSPTAYSPSTAFILYTSGTTGKPTGILAGTQSFIRNVADLRAMLPVDSVSSFLVSTSVFTSYGLSLGVFLPLLLGRPVSYIELNHPATMAACVRPSANQCMITNPAVLKKIAEYPDSIRSLKQAGLTRIISSGASLPAECFTLFGEEHGIAVTDSYGTSETNGIGLKENSFSAPIRILPSVETRFEAILRDDTQVLGYSLLVKGPKNMAGYTNITQPNPTTDGWIRTADITLPADGNSFHIVGRMSSMIRINGHRVQAETVEDIIERLDGIQEALVYGETHPTRGELLCARIVVREGVTAPDLGSLMARLAPQLPPHMIPRKIELVPGIEKNNGKKVRWAFMVQ